MYRRNEVAYLLPMKHSIPDKKQYVMNTLDRSFTSSGLTRTHSGQGTAVAGNSWLSGIYQSADPFLANRLGNTTNEQFPVRKLFNLVQEYVGVWGERNVAVGKKTFSERRGPFPFVDDNVTLLRELKPRDIFYSRARPRVWRHPKWSVFQFWRRRHFGEYISRKRAIDEAAKQEVAKKVDAKKKK